MLRMDLIYSTVVMNVDDISNAFLLWQTLELCVGPAPSTDYNYAAVYPPEDLWSKYAILMP